MQQQPNVYPTQNMGPPSFNMMNKPFEDKRQRQNQMNSNLMNINQMRQKEQLNNKNLDLFKTKMCPAIKQQVSPIFKI